MIMHMTKRQFIIDNRKIAVYSRNYVEIEMLSTSIKQIQEIKSNILSIYPEAKDFRVIFENMGDDIVVKLVFYRYETDEEMERAKKEDKKQFNSFLFILALIIASCVIIVVPKISETNLEENDYQSRYGRETTSVDSYEEERKTSSTTSVDSYEEEKQKMSSTTSKRYRDITFRNNQDVYNYLNGNSFVADNGTIIRFDTGGRYLYANGKLLYTDVRVIELRSDKAIIKVDGPYGGSTLAVMLEDYAHYLYDVNDGVTYDGKW